jgi:hypothetical protein
MSVTTNATIASFGGKLLKLSHAATTTICCNVRGRKENNLGRRGEVDVFMVGGCPA